MTIPLPTHPASCRELIALSFRLYRASFSRVILFSFLLALIAFIPRILSLIIGHDINWGLTLWSPVRLWFVVMDLAAMLFLVAIFWRIHCTQRNKHESLFEDVWMGLRKALFVFIAVIIQVAIVFLFVMLIVYGNLLLNYYNLMTVQNLGHLLFTFCVFLVQALLLLYVSTLFVFLIPLIAIENAHVFSALTRSVSLVWNHALRTFILAVTPWFFYSVALTLIRYVFGIRIHLYFVTTNADAVLPTILNIIIFTLFIPWSAALLFAQLKDLELRKKIHNARDKHTP